MKSKKFVIVFLLALSLVLSSCVNDKLVALGEKYKTKLESLSAVEEVGFTRADFDAPMLLVVVTLHEGEDLLKGVHAVRQEIGHEDNKYEHQFIVMEGDIGIQWVSHGRKTLREDGKNNDFPEDATLEEIIPAMKASADMAPGRYIAYIEDGKVSRYIINLDDFDFAPLAQSPMMDSPLWDEMREYHIDYDELFIDLSIPTTLPQAKTLMEDMDFSQAKAFGAEWVHVYDLGEGRLGFTVGWQEEPLGTAAEVARWLKEGFAHMPPSHIQVFRGNHDTAISWDGKDWSIYREGKDDFCNQVANLLVKSN